MNDCTQNIEHKYERLHSNNPLLQRPDDKHTCLLDPLNTYPLAHMTVHNIPMKIFSTLWHSGGYIWPFVGDFRGRHALVLPDCKPEK